MEKYLIEILGTSKEFIIVLAFLFVYHRYKSFFTDLKSVIINWFGLDTNTKIDN